jgi:hypothetical protein
MSRLDSHAFVSPPGQGTAIPSRCALLSIIGTVSVLVLGLTLASPGRADRQLIERGAELMTLVACMDDDGGVRDQVLGVGLRVAA